MNYKKLFMPYNIYNKSLYYFFVILDIYGCQLNPIDIYKYLLDLFFNAYFI